MVSVKTSVACVLFFAFVCVAAARADSDLAIERLPEPGVLDASIGTRSLLGGDARSLHQVAPSSPEADGGPFGGGFWAVIPRDVVLFEKARRKREAERARRARAQGLPSG